MAKFVIKNENSKKNAMQCFKLEVTVNKKRTTLSGLLLMPDNVVLVVLIRFFFIVGIYFPLRQYSSRSLMQ